MEIGRRSIEPAKQARSDQPAVRQRIDGFLPRDDIDLAT
jgi:hypothetical protein